MRYNISFQLKRVKILFLLHFFKSLNMSGDEFLVVLKFQASTVMRYYSNEIEYSEFKEMIISEFPDLHEIKFMKWNDDFELNNNKDLDVIKKLHQRLNKKIVIYINKYNDCYETNVDETKATDKELEFMRLFVLKGLNHVPSKHLRQNIIHYVPNTLKKMLVVKYKESSLGFCPGCIQEVNCIKGMNKHKCAKYDIFKDKLIENELNEVEINGNIWKVFLQGV